MQISNGNYYFLPPTQKLAFSGKKGVPKVVVQHIRIKHRDSVLDVLSEVFINEPTTHALGYTRQKCRHFFRSLVNETIDDANEKRRTPLSIFTRHGLNSITGVCINRDFLRPLPTQNSHLNRLISSEAHIMGPLEQTARDSLLGNAIGSRRRNQVFLIGWLAVAPQYQGKGQATRLVQESLFKAEDAGFTHAIAFATSPASARVFEKSGFTTLATAPYCLSPEREYSKIPGEMKLMHFNLKPGKTQTARTC